jgi:hypothetical protein
MHTSKKGAVAPFFVGARELPPRSHCTEALSRLMPAVWLKPQST